MRQRTCNNVCRRTYSNYCMLVVNMYIVLFFCGKLLSNGNDEGSERQCVQQKNICKIGWQGEANNKSNAFLRILQVNRRSTCEWEFIFDWHMSFVCFKWECDTKVKNWEEEIYRKQKTNTTTTIWYGYCCYCGSWEFLCRSFIVQIRLIGFAPWPTAPAQDRYLPPRRLWTFAPRTAHWK